MLAPQRGQRQVASWDRDGKTGLWLAFQVKASECEQSRTVGTGKIAEVADADEASGQTCGKSGAETRLR